MQPVKYERTQMKPVRQFQKPSGLKYWYGNAIYSITSPRCMQLTQPVCDEGMPPEPMSRVKSHLRSLYQYVKSLSVCAITNASTAATHGLHGIAVLSGLALCAQALSAPSMREDLCKAALLGIEEYSPGADVWACTSSDVKSAAYEAGVSQRLQLAHLRAHEDT